MGIGGRLHFRYAPPVGDLVVRVRDNRGSDSFIFGEVFDHRYYHCRCRRTRRPFSTSARMPDSRAYCSLASIPARRSRASSRARQRRALARQPSLNGVNARVFAAAVAVDDGRVTMTTDRNDYGHKVAKHRLRRGGRRCSARRRRDLGADTPQATGWERIGLLKSASKATRDLARTTRRVARARGRHLHRVSRWVRRSRSSALSSPLRFHGTAPASGNVAVIRTQPS